MNIGLPNQALERTGLSLWVLPWSFGLAHISGPVAQLGSLVAISHACTAHTVSASLGASHR
jgi:hypothetical protein